MHFFFVLGLVQDARLSQNPPPKASGPSKNQAAVHNWSKDDVQAWLKDNELNELCDTFRNFRGRHLEKMYSSYCEDENTFQEELKTDYKMDAKTRTEFVVALEDAFQQDWNYNATVPKFNNWICDQAIGYRANSDIQYL